MKNIGMKKRIAAAGLAVISMAAATQSEARDTRLLLSIDEAMNTPAAKEKLDPSIRFVFAGQSHPRATRDFGNFVTNKKTNAFNKSDEEACRWVMLSALLSLQDRVKSEGGNAVINIESYYDRQPMASSTQYECHAGALMAGVALQGDVVTLP